MGLVWMVNAALYYSKLPREYYGIPRQLVYLWTELNNPETGVSLFHFTVLFSDWKFKLPVQSCTEHTHFNGENKTCGSTNLRDDFTFSLSSRNSSKRNAVLLIYEMFFNIAMLFRARRALIFTFYRSMPIITDATAPIVHLCTCIVIRLMPFPQWDANFIEKINNAWIFIFRMRIHYRYHFNLIQVTVFFCILEFSAEEYRIADQSMRAFSQFNRIFHPNGIRDIKMNLQKR